MFLPSLLFFFLTKCTVYYPRKVLYIPFIIRVFRFVGHSHRRLENRTCHWGFDSSNWRSYLLLAKKDAKGNSNDIDEDKQTNLLDEVKERFNIFGRSKRKVGVIALLNED